MKTVPGYCYHPSLHSVEFKRLTAYGCARGCGLLTEEEVGYYDTLHHFGSHTKQTPVRASSDDPDSTGRYIAAVVASGFKPKAEILETDEQFLEKMEWMWSRTMGHRNVPQLPRRRKSLETPPEISSKWLNTGYVELEYRAPHGRVYALLLAGMDRNTIARKLKVSRRTIDARCEDIVMPEQPKSIRIARQPFVAYGDPLPMAA